MEHFYDGQIKRYLTQFMRLMSNFAYKDAKGKIVQIPVRYGDMNRQVAQLLTKNSENIVQSAPFIACYIKGLDFARDRLQDPTYVSKMNFRERAYDENGQEYLNVQGANYTVERLMPTPFNLQFTADIWTTNTDQKLQLLEQLLVLFNPSMEIQTNSNYIDWTSLSLLELTNLVYTSRQVPQGLEQDIDIATLSFTAPIWLTTPAKVKKLGIITNIITSMFADQVGTVASGEYGDGDVDYFSGRVSISVGHNTLGNLGVLLVDGTAKIMRHGENATPADDITVTPSKFGPDVNWNSILDLYPGKFTAGLSTIRFLKPDGGEIVGALSLDPMDDSLMHVVFEDQETLPSNTRIDAQGVRDGSVGFDGASARGDVDAIIDPTNFNPRPEDQTSADGLGWPATDIRYLILEDIVGGQQGREWTELDSNGDPVADRPGVRAWTNQDGTAFTAQANDIIRWDGTQWSVIFTSAAATDLTYITNSRTRVQYAWDGSSWMKSYEGVYGAGKWRLVL